ncbi:hypothetical protein [Streptomyces sp. NPDC048521]|uniref:hypothetical protein n=1 Tax=Streptomyces sp. NPDC048521 TaxID=3365566 RepID=UPI003723713A
MPAPASSKVPVRAQATGAPRPRWAAPTLRGEGTVLQAGRATATAGARVTGTAAAKVNAHATTTCAVFGLPEQA